MDGWDGPSTFGLDFVNIALGLATLGMALAVVAVGVGLELRRLARVRKASVRRRTAIAAVVGRRTTHQDAAFPGGRR